MGLREKLNRNPLIAGVAAVVLVGVGVWVIWNTVTDQGLTAQAPKQYYFTTDEGKTLFAAPINTVPPFEKDGQTAVMARVFTCDKGKTQFIGYLMKYTDTFAKRAVAEMASRTETAEGPGPLESSAAAMSTLVKKPGEKEWLGMTHPRASDITGIWCPSRDPWDLVELYPK